MLSYHEHNEAARVAEAWSRASRPGERIALVTDAGMPGISDPGARLVRAALDAGVELTVLPGASAVETALVGRARGRALHVPRGSCRASKESLALWREHPAWTWPGHRLRAAWPPSASLGSPAAFDPGRRVAVCRELTKRFEEIVRGAPASWPCASRSRRKARSPSLSGLVRASPILAMPARRSPSSSRPGRRGGWLPTSSPDSRTPPATSSIGALCDNCVISFDNNSAPSLTVV